jgi:hypothetical protein
MASGSDVDVAKAGCSRGRRTRAALAAAREYRSLGAKVTLVVHEMKRLGRGP